MNYMEKLWKIPPHLTANGIKNLMKSENMKMKMYFLIFFHKIFWNWNSIKKRSRETAYAGWDHQRDGMG